MRSRSRRWDVCSNIGGSGDSGVRASIRMDSLKVGGTLVTCSGFETVATLATLTRFGRVLARIAFLFALSAGLIPATWALRP
ncbi:hypothetical protein GCM10009799_18270 [Nocardiopsis rhodophaea]|uniref:Uncharacterized protein n=1 Tax=Nocardiopsis rhodophaea TaxID=280238 RepID=A0ABN2SV51_9ACTN